MFLAQRVVKVPGDQFQRTEMTNKLVKAFVKEGDVYAVCRVSPHVFEVSVEVNSGAREVDVAAILTPKSVFSMRVSVTVWIGVARNIQVKPLK